jgi:hypothetical protein
MLKDHGSFTRIDTSGRAETVFTQTFDGKPVEYRQMDATKMIIAALN